VGVGWAVWLTWALALFYIGNGVANFFNTKPFREGYEKWRLPPWFHNFNGVFQVVTGALLVFAATRWLGFLMAIAVSLGVYGTLIRHREFSHLPPITILTALLLIAMWGLYP
jgi:hypothetical protein